MTRTHNVQTPGDAGKPTPKAEDNNAAKTVAPVPPGQATPPVDLGTSDSSKAAAQTTRKAGKPTREDYANMRAEDIDPTTLTAPVLSKDGYVVPAPKEAK